MAPSITVGARSNTLRAGGNEITHLRMFLLSTRRHYRTGAWCTVSLLVTISPVSDGSAVSADLSSRPLHRSPHAAPSAKGCCSERR